MKIQLQAKQFTLNTESRTISGIATQYGIKCSNNLIIEKGALEYADPAYVKLLLDHNDEKPVGFALTINETDNDLRITFKVAETELGDYALDQAAKGLRDALSVGFACDDDGYTWDENQNAYIITKARLYETSLVACPAFEGARITEVKAHLNQKEGNNPMFTEEQLAQLREMMAATLSANTTQPMAPVIAAANPPAINTSENTALSLRQVEANIGKYIADGRPLEGIGAAVAGEAQYLTELTPDLDQDENGNGIAYLRPQWIGEIWEASKDGRPFIESLGTPNKLTAPKMLGFRKKWTHPIVGPWDCSKDVPTGGTPELEPVEVEAHGLAGAVAICRIWFDFGGSKIQDDWFAEAGKDYARQVESQALGAALTEATQLTAAASIPAALLAISTAASKLGFRIDHIRMGAKAYADYANLPADKVPWWLQKQGAVDIRDGKLSISPNLTAELAPELPDYTVLAYDKRAFKFWETPWFRVTAHEIQERLGWIDVGVFRYWAMLVTDPRAVLRLDVIPAGTDALHVIVDGLPVVDADVIVEDPETVIVNVANPNAPKGAK